MVEIPLELKRLPVRVALAGHVSKGIWVGRKVDRNGWEPFAHKKATGLKPARVWKIIKSLQRLRLKT